MLTFRESGHGVFRDALYYFSNTFVNQNIKKKKKKKKLEPSIEVHMELAGEGFLE